MKLLAGGHLQAQQEVDITKELQQGKIYWNCKVTGYSNGYLSFSPLLSSNSYRVKVKSTQGAIDLRKTISGTMPTVGDTVLIVQGAGKKITLMAQSYDSLHYRFWAPSRKQVVFKYKRPVKPVPGFSERISEKMSEDYFLCDDGCLYPKGPVDSNLAALPFVGPKELHLNSLKFFALKVSFWEPGLGIELKLANKLSFSSMTVQHFLHLNHGRADPVIYHSYKPYMTNELRYYFVPFYGKPKEGVKTKFSGTYGSISHVHSFNNEDIHLDAMAFYAGVQSVGFRFVYVNFQVGYLTNFHNANQFRTGVDCGLYF